jgi:hypothetical protein
MKAEQITALENYFKTKNEHWNGYTFEMLCEVLQQGKFENLELPLQLFTEAESVFTRHHETPLQAVQQFAGELDKHKLSAAQKIFVCERILKYLKETEYDFDLTPIKNLLKSQNEKLKAENEPKKPQVKNLRETLKEIMQKEIEQLPETLKELEPAQRLNIICKLAPFVLPKIESEPSENGTGFNW